MRLKAIGLGLSLVLGLAGSLRAADEPKPVIVDLWPGQPPGDEPSVKDTFKEEKITRGRDGKAIVGITNITKPTLTVYRPDKAIDTGAAIVVCPGGGYNALAWDHEGEQVARWLNSIGVTSVILKYRVPRRPGHPNGPPPQALMDAQRAMSLVRSKAGEWGIDPTRIGILGFSAGGHLGAWASTNADKRSYETIDDVDKVDCRPDFAVLIYPGGVLKRGTTELSPEIRVSDKTPPTFFAHANDDNPESSLYLYLALKKAKVPVEIHTYNSGGHGFGLRPTGKPAATWPKRCEEWLADRGIIKANKK
jgi:acetyl esterase/lipase